MSTIDDNLSLVETMRDLVEAAERWTEELARRSLWLEFFVLVVIGVAAAFHVVMVLRGLTPVNGAIIVLSWIVFSITLQKYHRFTTTARSERDEWKARFQRLRERETALSRTLDGPSDRQ
jgi:hypothetical protein